MKPEAKPDAKPEPELDAAESFRRMLADALAGSRAPVEELPKSIKELQELLDKANAGDRTDLPKVRTMLDTSPADALLMFAGDPAERRRLLPMHVMTGNEAQKAALAKHVASMRRKLIGKDASALVRLMADRLIGAWLDVCERHPPIDVDDHHQAARAAPQSGSRQGVRPVHRMEPSAAV